MNMGKQLRVLWVFSVENWHCDIGVEMKVTSILDYPVSHEVLVGMPDMLM